MDFRASFSELNLQATSPATPSSEASASGSPQPSLETSLQAVHGSESDHFDENQSHEISSWLKTFEVSHYVNTYECNLFKLTCPSSVISCFLVYAGIYNSLHYGEIKSRSSVVKCSVDFLT